MNRRKTKRVLRDIGLCFCRRSPPTDLLHKRQKIADSPVVGDLAILDAHDIDCLEMNLAMSWSDSKEWPLMSAIVGLVSSHSIAISKLPMDLRMKVREGDTKIGVEFSHTGLVGCRSRLRCVVDEIVSKELVESIEVSPPLDFFGV